MLELIGSPTFIRDLFEKINSMTAMELTVLVVGIWFLILAANALARLTPNETDDSITGRVKSFFRRFMRVVGAEPPISDK